MVFRGYFGAAFLLFPASSSITAAGRVRFQKIYDLTPRPSIHQASTVRLLPLFVRCAHREGGASNSGRHCSFKNLIQRDRFQFSLPLPCEERAYQGREWGARRRLDTGVRLFSLPFQTGANRAAANRVTEFFQRDGLDLADALTGHAEMPPDLFQRFLTAVFPAKSHHQDFPFAQG